MGAQGAQGAVLALGALLVILAPIVTAAPTLSESTDLDVYDGAGCYYNFQHYGEGDRIMTNEPCLNCTCHNRMLMCYLRVCPFTKPIGQDCKVENRGDQCCPIITCPDVPVDLMSATTSSPSVYSTEVGHHDNYGCSIDNKFYSEGARVPSKPNKPCELCYCIRNMTACVMQECTLHVEGCTPVYQKEVCCPVRYSCDHPEGEEPLMLDYLTTTERPTPGFMLTTTLPPGYTSECYYRNETYADGACITTDKACEHCYCMKGDMVCAVQECGTPMENEGKNCTALPAREGQCCPDTYICDGDEDSITTVDSLIDDQKPLRDHFTTVSEDFIENASDVPTLDAEKHDEEEATTVGQHDLATQTRAEKGESEEEKVETTTKFAHPDDKYHSTEKYTTDHYITKAPVVPGEEESTEPKDKDQKHDAVDDLQQTTLSEDEIISVTESHDDQRPELEMDDHKKPDEKETTVHDKYDEVTEHKTPELSTEHGVKSDEATEAEGQEVTEHVKHDAVTEHDGQEEVTEHVIYDESTEHVKHDEATEHEKHDEVTEHVKHDDTTEHEKQDEATEHVKHDEATEHVKHDEATEPNKRDEATEGEKYDGVTEHDEQEHVTDHVKYDEATEHVKHDETTEHVKHGEVTEPDKYDEATEHVKHDETTEHVKHGEVTEHDKYDEATEHVKHDETTEHVKHGEVTEPDKHDEATEHVKHDEVTEHDKHDETTEHVKHDAVTEHEKHDEVTEHVKHDDVTEHDEQEKITEHVEQDESTEYEKHDEVTEHVKHDGVTEYDEQEQVTEHEKYDEATEHVKHDEVTEHVKHDEATEHVKHDEVTEHEKHDESTEHVKHDEATEHEKHDEVTEHVKHDGVTDVDKQVTEHEKYDEVTEHVKHEGVTKPDEQEAKPEDETPQSTEKYPGDFVSHEDEHVVSTKSPLDGTTSHVFDKEVEGSGGEDGEIHGQKPTDDVESHEKSTVKSDVFDHTQQPDTLFTGPHDLDDKTQETIDDTQKTKKPSVDDADKEGDDHVTKAYIASTEKPGSDISSHTDDRFEHGEGDQGSGDAQHPDDFDSIFTTTSEFLTIPPLDTDNTKQDGEQGFTDDGLIYHEPHVTSIAPDSEKDHASEDEGKLTTPVSHTPEISSEKVPVTKASDEAPEEGEPDVHVDKDTTSDVPETTDRAHTSPKKEDSTEVPEPAVDSHTTHAGESFPHVITTQSSEKSDEATDKEVSEKTTEKSSDFTTVIVPETDQHVSTDAYDHDIPEQKPIDVVPQPPRIPGEGNCFIDGVSYEDGTNIPPISKCQATCQCVNSVLKCEHIPCSPPPPDMKNCQPILHAQETCCPTYICEQGGAPVIISDSHTYETTAVPSHDVTEQGDAHTVSEQEEISSEKDDSLLSHTARPEIDHTGYEYIKPGHDKPEIEEKPIKPSVYVPDCGTSGCSIDRTKSTPVEPASEDHTSPLTDDEKYQPTTAKSIPDSVTEQKEHDKDEDYTTESGAAKVSKKDEESEKPFIHDHAEDHTKRISDDGVTESILDVDSTTSKKIYEGVTDLSHVSEESTDKQHEIESDGEKQTETPKHPYDEQEIDEPSDYTTVSYDDDLGEPHGTDDQPSDEDEDKKHGTTKHPIHDISGSTGEEIEVTTESHVGHIPTDGEHKDVFEKPTGDEDNITEKVPLFDDKKHIGEETPSVDDTTGKLPSLDEDEDHVVTQSPVFDEKEHDTEKSQSEIDDKDHVTVKSPYDVHDEEQITEKSHIDDEEQITEKSHIDDDKHHVTESDQSQPDDKEHETGSSPTHIDGQEHVTEKLPSEDVGITTSRIPGNYEDELKTTISDLSESHTKDISDLGTTALPVVEKTTVSSDDVNKIGVSVLPTDVVDEDCGSVGCVPKKSEEKTTESGIIPVPVGDCGEMGCQVEAEFTRVPVEKHSTEKPTGIESDCQSGDCKVLPVEVQTPKTPDCGEAGCAADDQENIIGTDSECDGHECQTQVHDTTKKPTIDTSHTPTYSDCGEAGCGPEHGVDISKIPGGACEGSDCDPGKETTSTRTPEGSENEITDEVCGPAGCGPEESHTKKPLISDCNEPGCKDETHKPSQEDKPVHKDGTADCDSAECKYQPKPSDESEAPDYTTEHKIPHGDDEDLQTNELDDELKTKPVDVDQHPIEGSTESVTDDKCTDGVCGDASTDKTPIVRPEDGKVTDEHKEIVCVGDTCSFKPEISTDKSVEEDSTDISQKPIDEPECTAEKCEPSKIKPHKPAEVLPETETPDETSSEKEEHLTKAPVDQESAVTDVTSDIEKTTLSSTHIDKVPEHEHIDHTEQSIDTEKGTTSIYDTNAPDIKTEVPAIHDHTKTTSELESGEYPDHTLGIQTLSPDDQFDKQTTAVPSDINKDITEGVSKPYDEIEGITTQKSVADSSHVTKKVDEADEDESDYQKPIDHTVPESGYDDVTTTKAVIDSSVHGEHATGKPDVDGEEEKEKVPHGSEKPDGTSPTEDTEEQHTTEYSDTRTKGTSEKAPSEDESQFTIRPVVVEISTDKQQELDTKAPGLSDEQTTESATSKSDTKVEKPEDNLETVTKKEVESQHTEKPDFEEKTETPDITHVDHVTGKPNDQDQITGKPEYEHSTEHFETTQHDEEEGKPDTEHSTHAAGEYDIDKQTEKPKGEEPVESATEKRLTPEHDGESKEPSSSTDGSGDEHVTQISEKDRPEVDEEVTEVSEAVKPHREPVDHSTEKYDDGTETPKSPEHVDDGKEHDRYTTEHYDEQKLEKETESYEAGKITPIVKDHEIPEEGTEKPVYDTKTEKTEPQVTEQDTSKYETSSPEIGYDDHTQRLPGKTDDGDKVTEYPEIKYTDATEVYEMPEYETRRPALESDAHVMEVEKETKKPNVHVEEPTKEDEKPEYKPETGKPHHEIITDKPHDEKHEIIEHEKKTEKPDLEHITTKYEQPDVQSTEKVVGESQKPEHDGETERPHIVSTQQDSETEEETTKESELYEKHTKVPSVEDEQKTEAPEFKPSKDTQEMELEKESTEKTLIDDTSSYEKETKRPESTLPVQETEGGGKVTEIPEHDKEVVVDEQGTLRPSDQDKDEEYATDKPSKPIEHSKPLEEQETLRPDIEDEVHVTSKPSKPVDHETTEHGKPLHEDETRRPDIGNEEQATGKPYDVHTEGGKPVDEQQTVRPVVGDDEEITVEPYKSVDQVTDGQGKPLDEQDTLRPVVGEDDVTDKPSLPDHSLTEDETKRPGDEEQVTLEPFKPIDHVPTEHGKRPDIGDEEITDEPTKSVEDDTTEHEKPLDEQHTHRPVYEEEKSTDKPYKPTEHEKPSHEKETKRPVGDEEEVTDEPSEPIDDIPTEHGKPSDEKDTKRPVVGDDVTEGPSTPTGHASIDDEKHTRRPVSGEDEESTDKPYKPIDHIPSDHKKPSDEQETLRPDIGEDEESTDKPYKPADHIPTEHKKPSDEQETLRPDIGEDEKSTDKPFKHVDPTEHETLRPHIGEDDESTDKPYTSVDHIPTDHRTPSDEIETIRPDLGEDEESTDKPYKPVDHIPTEHGKPSDEQETLRPHIEEDDESTDKPYKPVDHIPTDHETPSDENETIRPDLGEDEESTDKPYKPVDHIPTEHGKPSDEQETLPPHIGEDEESTDKPYKPIDIPTDHETPSDEKETIRPDLGDEEQITEKHPQSDYDEKTEIPYHVKTEKPFVDEHIDHTTDSEIKETSAPTLELTTVGTPSGDTKTEKTTSVHPDDHTLKSDEERTTEKSDDVTGEHASSDEQGTEPPGHKPEDKPEHDHKTEKPQHGLDTVMPEDGQATEKATLYPHDYDKDHTKKPISDEDADIKPQHTTESDITHTEEEKITPHGGTFDEITTIRPLEDTDAEKPADEKEHVTKHPELESSEKTDTPSDDSDRDNTTEHAPADHEIHKVPEVPSEDVDKETDEVSHTTSRPLPETAHYTKPSASVTQSPFDEGYTSKYPMVHHTKPPSQVHDRYPDEEHSVPELPVPHHDHQVPDFHAPYGGNEQDYEDEDQSFGPGTCRYGGKVYVSAQQIPRDDPCDFCFCFRSDIICLQQSCPPPIQHCHEEPISGFCCPRYECPVSMATVLNVTTTTTTTTTTLPPHFLSHAYKGAAQRRGCQIKGQAYKVGEFVRSASGPCLHCTCGGDGQMKCDPKVCTPEPMLRQMIAVAATSRRR